jgi:hypothetical protein
MSKKNKNVRKIAHVTRKPLKLSHFLQIQNIGIKSVIVLLFLHKKEAEQLCSCSAGSFRSLTDFVEMLILDTRSF